MVGWCWKTSGGCGERERKGTICRDLGPRGGIRKKPSKKVLVPSFLICILKNPNSPLPKKGGAVLRFNFPNSSSSSGTRDILVQKKI